MLIRAPGGIEPEMIIERVKAGKTFDQALREVETLGQFRCEQWWVDLNRDLISGAAKPAPVPKPSLPKGKG